VLVPPSWSRRAEALAERIGLSYDRLLGLRFGINVLIATSIVWFALRKIGDPSPMWAIAAVVAASDPEPEAARTLFRSRTINVLVGCGVGFVFLLFGSGKPRMVPVSIAFTVLISTYLVRVKTMWRQAPITAAIVIAAGIAGASTTAGIVRGLHRVAEVLFGSLVGMSVSWLMSNLWLVRKPDKQATDVLHDNRERIVSGG
jgi:uncharacterized membrane protein YccC